MTALKTKFLKYIDNATNEEHLYEVIPPAPTETDRGGIIASPKTDDYTVEAKLGEDGKLYVPTIANGGGTGGVTSWNDLEDRPFYSEGGLVDILPLTRATEVNKPTYHIYEEIYLEPETTYMVEYNNITYECTTSAYFDFDGISNCIGLGEYDVMLNNSNPTGKYPFIIVIPPVDVIMEELGKPLVLIMDLSGASYVDISIKKNDEIIHKLDSKYLDRPFYISKEASTRIEPTDVIPEGTYTFYYANWANRYYSDAGFDGVMLEPNQKYFVIWDGTEYELECYLDTEEGDEYQYPSIGYTWEEFANGTTSIPFKISSEGYGEEGYEGYTWMETPDTSEAHSVKLYYMKSVEIPSEMYVEPDYLNHLQPDWDENDELKLGYIKNKPFGLTEKKIVIIPETENTFTNTADGDYYNFKPFGVEVGKTYYVKFDGVEYECVCHTGDRTYSNYSTPTTYGSSGTVYYIGGQTEPFIIQCYSDVYVWIVTEFDTHTIEISETIKAVVVNEKYESLQADWNENDKNFASFIKNKPFYHIKKSFVVAPETTVYVNEDYEIDTLEGVPFELGQTYKVAFNGTEYDCVCWYSSNWNSYTIGNGDIAGGYNQEGNIGGNGEPFAFTSYEDGSCYINVSADNAGEYTFKIEANIENLKKIDDKYQHQVDWEENDKTKASYILNKPFYSEDKSIEVLPLTEANSVAPGVPIYLINEEIELEPNTTYVVNYNGTDYECTSSDYIDGNINENTVVPFVYLGEYEAMLNDSAPTGKYPFVISTPPVEITKETIGEYYIQIYDLSGVTQVTLSLKKKGEEIIHKIDKKYIPDGVGVTSWNDLEDRPFGYYINSEVVIPETTIYVSNWAKVNAEGIPFEVGKTYKVTFNGTEYECVAWENEYGRFMLGNGGIYGDNDVNTGNTGGNGEPFLFDSSLEDDSSCYINVSSSGDYTFKVEEYKEETKKIDSKYLPDSISCTSFSLKDTVNGYDYIVEMRNGQLISYCKIATIEITSMPNNTVYLGGGTFDPNGMVITATRQDGTSFEVKDYIYSPATLNEEDDNVVISYTEGGIEYKLDLHVATTIDSIFVDFEYTEESDGTYTLTAWKGTLNGKPSTEIVIPNYDGINA